MLWLHTEVKSAAGRVNGTLTPHPAASVAQECHPNIPLLWRAVQGRVPTFMRVFSALSILPASFYKLILETSELCLLAFDLLVSFLYACQCNCMCVWPSFFLFAFVFCFFFIVPFHCFPNRIAPWVININIDIVDKLIVFQSNFHLPFSRRDS